VTGDVNDLDAATSSFEVTFASDTAGSTGLEATNSDQSSSSLASGIMRLTSAV
jgi:hypothetical protein